MVPRVRIYNMPHRSSGVVVLTRVYVTSPHHTLSAALGSFDYWRLPSSGVVLCTLLLLRAASSRPGLLVPPPACSKTKATHTDAPKKHKIPPHPKHPRLKKHFFTFGNPMYLVAAAINTNGDRSDMPIMQPTEHPRTSPQGLRVSEHMPRRPSCVCLPECSFSRATATGALEA